MAAVQECGIWTPTLFCCSAPSIYNRFPKIKGLSAHYYDTMDYFIGAPSIAPNADFCKFIWKIRLQKNKTHRFIFNMFLSDLQNAPVNLFSSCRQRHPRVQTHCSAITATTTNHSIELDLPVRSKNTWAQLCWTTPTLKLKWTFCIL